MPKQKINYDKCYFYKVVCNDIGIKDCYVGHTTDYTSRKCSHKARCINPLNLKRHYKRYEFIRTHGGWENWSMVLIDQCKCDNALEACKKERSFIEGLKATLNQIIPTRTATERNQINPNIKIEASHRYNEKNREDINRKCNERYHAMEKIVCPCGGHYRGNLKQRHEKTMKHVEYVELFNNSEISN